MHELGPTRGNVVAVVVTYHPDAEMIARLSSIAGQFGRLIVVDNHSGEETLARLRTLSSRERTVTLIENAENLGVATALNQGCRRAMAAGAAWVATFDQDSSPAADLLACVAQEWAAQPYRDRIGLLGVNLRMGIGKTQIPEGAGLADARSVITSGSLVNLAAWQEIGPFRDDFFIDEVDHEYALRMRRHGWSVKITRRVLMDHSQGSPRWHNLLGWRRAASHHSALRRYYMIRNRVHLAREHFRFDPAFVSGELGITFREAACILFFESHKFDKLRAMAQGFVDGLRGRAGRADWHVPPT